MNPLLTRSNFARAAAVFGGLLVSSAQPAAAANLAAGGHRISIQIDQNDPGLMNLSLNNIANMANEYGGLGQMFQIELVAFGPGLHMLRADDSPVKARLESIKSSIPDVVFSACNNTKTAMEKAEGHPIAIVPQARLVPAGIVRLVELQEAGWSYIRT